MHYKISLDKTARIITIAVTILFGVLILGPFLFLEEYGTGVSLLTSLFLAAVYFTAFAFRPVSYSLDREKLIIHRIFPDVQIDRKQMISAEVLEKDALYWSIRTFGVGGLFGYFGKFANAKLGNMTWYATRRDKTVLIKTAGNKKIILTPDDPNQFVADFNASL